MRQSFAYLLLVPLVPTALIVLYLTWTRDSEYAPWLIPIAVLVVAILVLAPKINWEYYSRYPPALEPPVVAMLERVSGFYQQLPEDDRKRFRDRVALFRMGTDWTAVGWGESEQLPVDVETALAVPAVMLTFNRPKFLFEKFEKVVVYPGPFPSPDYPFAHTSELHEGDGCLLFSAEHVLQAFVQPGNLYNIALHEYAKAFILAYPDEPYPALDTSATEAALEQISNMPRSHIESVVGLAGIAVLPIAVHHYFSFPARFAVVLSAEKATFDRIFAQKHVI
jgi:Glucose-regulated metallo-peptidase M90